MPETQKPKLGFCLLAGALAGFINGFFGAGGGMVLVPLLLWLVRLEDKAAFSSAVAVILPLCAVSIAVYAVHDSLPLRDALPYLIGGAAGGGGNPPRPCGKRRARPHRAKRPESPSIGRTRRSQGRRSPLPPSR